MNTDPVNKPAHYTKGGIECLDAIEASMTEEEFLGALKFNVMKYTWRWRDKGGAQDLEKAQFYLRMLIERVKKREASQKKESVFKDLRALQFVPHVEVGQ